MLLSVLTFIAIFLGGISFAGIVEAWSRGARKSASPSVSLNSHVSLWSLVLFLFFPTVSAPLVGDRFTRRSRAHAFK